MESRPIKGFENNAKQSALKIEPYTPSNYFFMSMPVPLISVQPGTTYNMLDASNRYYRSIL